MKVLNDRVIIKVEEATDLTAGGIMLPQKREDSEFEIGEVVGIGPGVHNESGTINPTSVKINDRVMYIKKQAFEIEINRLKFKVMQEDVIVVVL